MRLRAQLEHTRAKPRHQVPSLEYGPRGEARCGVLNTLCAPTRPTRVCVWGKGIEWGDEMAVDLKPDEEEEDDNEEVVLLQEFRKQDDSSDVHGDPQRL